MNCQKALLLGQNSDILWQKDEKVLIIKSLNPKLTDLNLLPLKL